VMARTSIKIMGRGAFNQYRKRSAIRSAK
jgi:hypothetical protein